MTLRANRDFRLVTLSVLAVLLAGCSIHTSSNSEDKNGKKTDVDIRSPFGSISVHEGAVDAKDIGLPAYPGAQPATGHGDGDDSDNANVNIASPLFGVKVVVQKFETNDSPDKVLAFYQKPMGKYGKVIQCSGGYHGGYHHHEKDSPVSCDNSEGGSEKELKVGTENDQHVLAVKPRGNGSEFTLVYVRAKEKNDKDTI
jgi:hypothetical protein